MNSPKAIRYHAKGMKLCELIYLNNQRTQINADMNAATAPTENQGKSATDKRALSLYME